MRLICYWHQRRLSRYLVLDEPILPESFLAQHLSHCPDCSRARADMVTLQHAVPRALPGASVSSEFDTALQLRLSAAMASASPMRTFPALTHVWSFLTVAGLVLALLGVGIQSRNPHPDASESGIASRSPAHTPSLIKTIVIETKTGTRVSVSPISRGQAHIAPSIAREPNGRPASRTIASSKRQNYGAMRGHRRHLQTTPQEVQQTNGPAMEIVCATANWREVGEVFAACGDHGSAYRAYEQAYAEDKDVDSALSASENASQTGDSAQALMTVARLLSEGINGDSQHDPAVSN